MDVDTLDRELSETDAEGTVRCCWKEGVNAGVSGELCHYHDADLTAVVLSKMENGAWEPAKAIDRLVTLAR